MRRWSGPGGRRWMRQVLPRLGPLVAVAGLLVLPVASCTSRGSEKVTTVKVTGVELLRNRSPAVGDARHSIEYFEWLRGAWGDMAPRIGHEGPSDRSPGDAKPPDPPPERDGAMFEGNEQWLRVLFAAVVLLGMLASALPPRPLGPSLLAGFGAGGLLLFLRLTEGLVRDLLRDSNEATELRWGAGSYVALFALGASAVAGPILERRRASGRR